MIPPLRWNEKNFSVQLLDQTRLPAEEVWLELTTPEAVAEAIRRLRVRGAPAIGIAAAFGVVLALREDGQDAHERIDRAAGLLESTRPTAVNLFHALSRMREAAASLKDARLPELRRRLLEEARAVFDDDLQAGRLLGEHGLSLLHDGACVLTHCHAGGVATSGYGTALAPLILAAERGLRIAAYIDETRPLLQGSRITAWELQKSGVPATLISDSMAGHVMQDGRIDAVIVGADRVAANGDVANKIGTYSLAVLAHAHDLPFYVSVPLSTIDMATPTGADIAIEERDPDEITHGFGRRTAPVGISVYNPAFDVTPARLVTAFVTERGVLRPPYDRTLRAVFEEVVA